MDRRPGRRFCRGGGGLGGWGGEIMPARNRHSARPLPSFPRKRESGGGLPGMRHYKAAPLPSFPRKRESGGGLTRMRHYKAAPYRHSRVSGNPAAV